MKRRFETNVDTTELNREYPFSSHTPTSTNNFCQLLGLVSRRRLTQSVTKVFHSFFRPCLNPSSSISESPVWDPDTGFGGDGVPGTYTVPPDPANTSRIRPLAFRGCVQDGPFANYTLRLGPGQLISDHCLTRGLNDTASLFLNTTAIDYLMTLPTYDQFHLELEGSPAFAPDHRAHDGGHVAVGGEMSNFYSSPGGRSRPTLRLFNAFYIGLDPIFYLHHANLDRIWWRWQKSAPPRLFQVSGNTSISSPGNLTLDYLLQMGNLGPTVPVRDVMDIHSEPYCYTYI